MSKDAAINEFERVYKREGSIIKTLEECRKSEMKWITKHSELEVEIILLKEKLKTKGKIDG
jgi:hypothetical protein